MPLVLLLAAGCGHSVLPLYNAARDAALAEPGPPPADWEPDLVVQLGAPVVEDLLKAATRAQGDWTTRLKLGPAEVVPTVHLKSLTLVPGRPCEPTCVGLDAAFDGTIEWTAGPVHGSVPIGARGALDAVFVVERADDAFVVTAAPRKLRDLAVDLGDLEGSIAGIKREVRQALEAEVIARVPPQRIARFPSGDVPVRAARIALAGDAVKIELLTSVPVQSVAAPRPPPDDGFTVAIATDALLGIAREEAFRHGPVAMGVVPEPTALSFGEDGFAIGLRLWRIEGVGWWRDYTVTGTAEVRNGKLVLAPKEVVEGEKSKGAALADPLAALGEGLILRAIEDAVNTSVPLGQALGKLPLNAALTGIEGGQGTVYATGSAEGEVGRERPGRR